MPGFIALPQLGNSGVLSLGLVRKHGGFTVLVVVIANHF